MRDRVLAVIMTALFVLLLAGLFYTQIVRFGYYHKLSKNNSIRVIPIDGPRGSIYDRSGVPLVTNRLSFDVAIIYQELRDRKTLVRLLNNVLGMTGEQIAAALEKAAARSYVPVVIAGDIDKAKAFALEEESFNIDGLIVETRSKRNYIYNFMGSHVFGYLSEITEDELDALKEYGYRMKDLVGRDGIEKYYESLLKGVDGGTQIEVDNRGSRTRVLGLKEPAGGKDIFLTIDMVLQTASDKLLGDRKGAVVVINPATGEVLALASHPSFDPNIFVKPDTNRQRLKLMCDRVGRPLSNRAISGLYPPGSVFKLVTATAALETRKINQWTRFFCAGSYKLGSATFDCWKEGGHGSQSVREGLMNSCNVFFYNTGRVTGIDAIEEYTKLFGYGKPTGVDLPDEVKGIVPGRIWKRLQRKDGWYEGETLNYAIGQGYLLVTPIQVVCMTAIIANKGSLVRPYLVKQIGADPVSNAKSKGLGIRPETILAVREGMREVVNNEGGTGKRAKLDGVVVAGKTGTAQNPQGRTHAWFTGFAPYNDPKICVVVFLEHGGKGGLEPAEIAHGIFEEAKKRGYL